MPYVEATPFFEWKEVISQILFHTLNTPLPFGDEAIRLCEIEPKSCYHEVEFLFSCQKDPDFLKGVIDFVFAHKGKYYLVDWKSNWLGPSGQDYSFESMDSAMSEHQYYLQASIYREALKRYLKIMDERTFAQCFGGCYYLFLRGITPEDPSVGVFSVVEEKPSEQTYA